MPDSWAGAGGAGGVADTASVSAVDLKCPSRNHHESVAGPLGSKAPESLRAFRPHHVPSRDGSSQKRLGVELRIQSERCGQCFRRSSTLHAGGQERVGRRFELFDRDREIGTSRDGEMIRSLGQIDRSILPGVLLVDLPDAQDGKSERTRRSAGSPKDRGSSSCNISRPLADALCRPTCG